MAISHLPKLKVDLNGWKKNCKRNRKLEKFPIESNYKAMAWQYVISQPECLVGQLKNNYQFGTNEK